MKQSKELRPGKYYTVQWNNEFGWHISGWRFSTLRVARQRVAHWRRNQRKRGNKLTTYRIIRVIEHRSVV